MRKFTKSPLPFLGQKRNWLKRLRTLDLSGRTVIDLFGGSGIVAHTLKHQNPTARVIWNDYDNFIERIAMIKETELLRQSLRADAVSKRIRVSEEEKFSMLKVIKSHERTYGRVDWITLSSWLLYPGNYAHDYEDLAKRGWYYSVVQTPLTAEGYLVGVERVSLDFRALLAQYEDDPNVVYIADPPYIMTNQTGYVGKSGKFFKLADGVALIQALHKKPALFFSSPKSETDSLFNVFTPDTLAREDFETSIGRTRVHEMLYFLNWPSEEKIDDKDVE